MVSKEFLLPDTIWENIEGLIPKKQHESNRGRKPLDPYLVACGIYYVLRTGCQWKAVPNCFGSGSSIHRYFQEWNNYGVFLLFWQSGLMYYDKYKKINWKNQSIDTSLVKAPLGGDHTGRNPTDRSKYGTKRSIIIDGNGIPLSLVIGAANVHDSQFIDKNLDNIIVPKYRLSVYPDKLCADKAYDGINIDILVLLKGLKPVIAKKGRINSFTRNWKRWSIERTFSWINKFKKVSQRWEKRSENYEGLIQFVLGVICLRASGILG